MFRREDVSGDPIVVGDTTYTPVARAHGFSVRRPQFAFGRAWARPHHVEVLDGNGTRSTIRIPNAQRAVVVGAQIAAFAVVAAIAVARRSR